MTSPEESVKPFLSMKKYPRKISSTLNMMRKDGINTDIMLVCNDKEFPAHQLILSAGSTYFKKMFESEFKESLTKRIDFSYVKESTLVCILDFLYLSEPNLAGESIEDLMEIHDMSHLFGITELSDFCWKLINRHITIENYVNIWNMRILYTDEYCFEEILKFILENFKTVIERESFLTLNGSQMRLLLQRIREKKIPADDYLFERILQWIKTDEEKRREMVKLFYYLDFDLVSKECIEEALNLNKTLFSTGFMKTFFDIHVLPVLKPKDEIERLKNPSSTIDTNYNISSIKRFTFGRQIEIKDNNICDQYDALIINDINCTENGNLKRLPLVLSEVQFCFHSKSVFYIVRQETSSSNLFFTAYNWKSNSIVFDVPIPHRIHVATGCTTGNDVYLIGRPEKNGNNNVILVHRFTQSTQYWNSAWLKDTPYLDEIIVSVHLKGVLHILCYRKKFDRRYKQCYDEIYGPLQDREMWTYFNCIIENNLQDHSSSEKMKLEKKFILNKQLVTAYNDKLYVFFVYESKILYCMYNPNINLWNRFEVSFDRDLGTPIKCISNNDRGIFFYAINGNLIYFNSVKSELKLVQVKIPLVENIKNFFSMMNTLECDIFLTFTEDAEN